MTSVDAAVVGAGGPTGSLCVQKLLEEKKTVRAIVRSPEKYKDKLPSDPKITVVKGDVTDPSSLEAALKGAKGVIFAASGQTYFSANAVDKEVRASEGYSNCFPKLLLRKCHLTCRVRFFRQVKASFAAGCQESCRCSQEGGRLTGSSDNQCACHAEESASF